MKRALSLIFALALCLALSTGALAADEIIAAIGHTAETAHPMPNIAEMSVMWGPAESMLAAVNKNGEDVASAAETAQAAALQAIADMQ